ncbi:MAG: hypothetical protein ACHQU1_03330 [Gemmatimonadales bacterium]
MRTGLWSTVILAAALAAPVRAQEPPAWDAGRHVLVVVSGLDSADAYPVVVRAFEAEGLRVEHSDTARGRIICEPRSSDTYGGGQATVQYIALVHRVQHGGSEIWIGAMLHTVGGQGDPSAFARVPTGATPHQRLEGDYVFISPRSGTREWERLDRIAQAVAHTTTR